MARLTGFALLLLAMISIVGCRQKNAAVPIITIDDNEPNMKAAIEKARATVDTFIAAVKAPKPGQDSFSVKWLFSDGLNKEHMWIGPVRYTGKAFFGPVNNQPDKLTNVKRGQKQLVQPETITDWMYLENGKLVGGFTLGVLRERMPPKERAEFDKNLPFVID